MRPSSMKATNTMTILCWLYMITVPVCTVRAKHNCAFQKMYYNLKSTRLTCL